MSRGKVKWFDVKKGYGFIEWEKGKDVFIHYTEIQTNSEFKKVNEGDIVEFELIEGNKGLQAKKVIIVK
ncbi:MAG: cold shock domain-containing protein [Bacteroidota bacterium]|nr:cold shock domain-containing protein [Bacteroidota bacterium]